MITRDDIQSWLERLDGGSLTVMEIEPNLWLTRTPDDAEVVVHYAPPVAILRVRVMELPASEPRRGELFRQLLEYNARELVHGSYGLEGDHVVLTDTLELENLDFSEFEASFDHDLAELPALRPRVHHERRRDAGGQCGGEELVRRRPAPVTAEVVRLVGDQAVLPVDHHLLTERAGNRAGCRGEAHDLPTASPPRAATPSG